MSSWTPGRLAAAYDTRLLDWTVGASRPVRARISLEMLQEAGVPLDVEGIDSSDVDALRAELAKVHTAEYVSRTLDLGLNEEWSGVDGEQGAVALHMFAGTVALTRAIQQGRVGVGFSPQGAKHHAQRDHGSGFCVFNDFAWAALELASEGRRVMYVDLDAHHGDGVENLTRDEPLVRTFSVHDRTIFPGTGRFEDPTRGVFNAPLQAGAGDSEMLEAVARALTLMEEWRPQAVLVAVGGDGFRDDPLSTLQYSYEGYERAGGLLGAAAAGLRAPLLMGGAGGYLPETATPRCWAIFVEAACGAYWQKRGRR